jgi:uncharacterized protein YbcI
MDRDISGETLASISRELVRLQAQYYGKGATQAKSYVCDDWVFAVLKDGLTTSEQTLLAHDEHELVRTTRLRFQDRMADAFTDVVRKATGRNVLTYHSQVLFEPHYSVEIFLLGDVAEA